MTRLLPPPSYDLLVSRVVDRCAAVVSAGSTVLVVSRGDNQLLKIESCTGRHFPADEQGQYAGHHPRDSRSAIEQLEAARDGGADYLVIPATSAWWLDYYKEFAAYL